jgi:hypothetical protein
LDDQKDAKGSRIAPQDAEQAKRQFERKKLIRRTDVVKLRTWPGGEPKSECDQKTGSGKTVPATVEGAGSTAVAVSTFSFVMPASGAANSEC